MLACPGCGQENPEGFRFCGACGAALGREHVAREERKVITVLFCDLVGSTEQAERLDPEDVRALLSGYYEHVRGEVERFGGTVEKFIGDAVMALFGAPVAHEDEPERAVRAALAIRDWAADQGVVRVRVGITTGEALVSLGARPERGEAMAAGDVVNTAARLQTAAPVDGILVDETTFRATERAIDYASPRAIQAKGKAEPVAAWEAQRARSRLGVDVRQLGATPLVGRKRERIALVEALARAREERMPQLVTLVGAPGIGKSRLVWELFREVEEDPELVTWRQGRSLPYGEGVAFWALGEIVKAEAGILETDGEAEAAAKLRRAVRTLVADAREAEWVERHVRPLVGVESAGDGGGERAEAFAAWRRFLESLAEQRPLVLVFEDLHFAEEGLLDFVDHLVEWVSGVPLVVVATARPELLARRSDWGGGKQNAVTLSLPPLSDAETASLVHAVLERSVLDVELQGMLLERAGGNPLYAEEFARLVAAGRAPSDLPETVQGIVAARLDLLSGEEKRLLQAASVVGKVFWLGALAGMGGGERWTLEQRLHELERKEFVRRERLSSVAGETEYVFRHVLVRDVAYAQIPRGERAVMHRLAAEWIESLGRSEGHAEQLAHHYASALELARAVGADTGDLAPPARLAFRDAGDRASALSAFVSAVRFYRAALELWPDSDAGRPMLLFRLARALWQAEAKGYEEAAEAIVALAESGDRAAAAEALILSADIAMFAGHRNRVDEHVKRAAALIEDLPPSRAKALVATHISRFSMLEGDYTRAIELGREALALAEALELRELQARALNTIGICRVNDDDPGGSRDLERSIALAEGVSVVEQSRAINNLATVLFERGDVRRSLELHERMLELTCEYGIAPGMQWAEAERANELYFLGRWQEALPELDRLLAAWRTSPHYMEPICLAARAAIRLARDDSVGAVADSRRGLERAREVEDPQALYTSLAAGVRILVATDHADEAADLADELVRRLDAAAYKPHSWFVELAIGLTALGRAEEVVRLASKLIATLWSEAAQALGRGDFDAAAEILERIGSLPHAAFVRRYAAENLLAQGRHAEANDQIQRPLAFWRSVHAVGDIREAEKLLTTAAARPAEQV